MDENQQTKQSTGTLGTSDISENKFWSLRKALGISFLLQLVLLGIPLISGSVGGYIVGRKSPHRSAFWALLPTFTAALVLSPAYYWKIDTSTPPTAGERELAIAAEFFSIFFLFLFINLVFSFLGALAGKGDYERRLSRA